MERATDAVLDKQASAATARSRTTRSTCARAALVVAIERVAHVALERGIWP